MKTTIYKYPLDLGKINEIKESTDSQILSAGLDGDGKLCVWLMVKIYDINDIEHICDYRTYFIEIFGTGHTIPVDMGVDRRFINTVVIGPCVWHIFERRT